jgi:tryptophanase
MRSSSPIDAALVYRPLLAAVSDDHRAVRIVIEVVLAVAGRAGELDGLQIVAEAPTLRHFTARFEPVG